MITSDLTQMIESISQEKGLTRDIVIEIVEEATETAARKVWGGDADISAIYDEDDGDVKIYEYRTVVEEVEDEKREILLEEARESDPDADVGDDVGFQLDREYVKRELGRIAAQTAKQILIQKLRDAERDRTFDEFKDRKGELITGVVRRIERGGDIVVDLNRAEAILRRREQVQSESYRLGDRIEAYVKDINRSGRRSLVELSRTHPNLLVKLFEREVPEIYEGVVRIEAVAREPGQRAKIAVSSIDPDVDPVGACVGLKGSRVQAVVNEVRGEAVDIVPWHADPGRFVIQAIQPAHVNRVYIDEPTHTMELIVPDDQLARAIGRRGQNVRLASDLVGWRIDVTPESRHEQQLLEAHAEIARIEGVDEAKAEHLVHAGFRSAQEISETSPSFLAELLGITESVAQAVIVDADHLVETLIMEEAASRKAAAVQSREED